MSVVGQAAGVAVSVATYVTGLVLVALGRRAWIDRLEAADREAWRHEREFPLTRRVVLVLGEFRSRPVLVYSGAGVLIVVVLFALAVSIWVELLFIAGVTIAFPAAMAGSVTRLGRVGTHVASLGYWGAVCFLAGLLVAIVR